MSNISYESLTTEELYIVASTIEEDVDAMRRERFALSQTLELHDTEAQERLIELNEAIDRMEIERANSGRQYKERTDRN